jgi:hypothetical protein
VRENILSRTWEAHNWGHKRTKKRECKKEKSALRKKISEVSERGRRRERKIEATTVTALVCRKTAAKADCPTIEKLFASRNIATRRGLD